MGTPQSSGINPGIPMYSNDSDSSTTKATLTEGRITLNKDSNPTQVTAQSLGINTQLEGANRQVAAPKDIHRELKDQQILSRAAGDVAGAVSSYVDSRKEALKEEQQAALEEAKKAQARGDVTTAEAKLAEANALENEANR
ncbi:hypothetical protein [[Mannheimia] succiniciproducens]|uniref:hypothetical protein n=1 Tax=[Mannheimia] succiniciproducens TaxID=157673 RepID=UPI0005A28E3B|nr:hypothetical protein [[Mannheimia] succiniciproducens]